MITQGSRVFINTAAWQGFANDPFDPTVVISINKRLQARIFWRNWMGQRQEFVVPVSSLIELVPNGSYSDTLWYGWRIK